MKPEALGPSLNYESLTILLSSWLMSLQRTCRTCNKNNVQPKTDARRVVRENYHHKLVPLEDQKMTHENLM